MNHKSLITKGNHCHRLSKIKTKNKFTMFSTKLLIAALAFVGSQATRIEGSAVAQISRKTGKEHCAYDHPHWTRSVDSACALAQIGDSGEFDEYSDEKDVYNRGDSSEEDSKDGGRLAQVSKRRTGRN